MAAILLTASSHAYAGGTHCSAEEKAVFSCSVSGAKVVSVCLRQSPAAVPAGLAYRFGSLGKPELVFPDTAAGSLRKFRYAHYFRYQVDRTELSFSNDGAEYSVFDYYDGEERPKHARGVRVSADGKDREFRCTSGVVSHLGELEPVVPCDAESALASCR